MRGGRRLELLGAHAGRAGAGGVLAAVMALSAGACGATSNSAPPTLVPLTAVAYTVHVLNVSGPPVVVLAAGTPIATVACGSGTDIPSTDGGLPPTPFTVVVRRADTGATLGQTTVGSPGDMAIQVRDETVAFELAFSGGPSVAPDACARWSQQP